MLTSREIAILRYLLKEKKELRIKRLAEKYALSERSIRYELEQLIEIGKEKGFIIEIEKGEITVKNPEKLASFLEEKLQYFLSAEEKKGYILLKICFERQINQSKLVEELDISKSTVKLYLKEIKELLATYSLRLEILARKGLQLEGEEENIRQLTLKAVFYIKKEKSIFLEEILQGYLNDISTEGAKLFINYCQKKMDKIISDEAYRIILRYLRVLIYCQRQGYKIENIKNENFLRSTEECKAILESKALLEAYYDLSLNDYEYLKIADYFLGAHTYNISYSYYENWVEIEVMIKNIINSVNEKIEMDISQDETLFLGLLNHIKPTIYRLRNHLELENSIYEEVIESYPNLFHLIQHSFSALEEFIGMELTKDELAYLTIHFKSSMDRNQKKKREKMKILIVCVAGYGSSKLLAQRLQELYRIEIVDIIPQYMVEKAKKDYEYDLLISTVEMEEEEKQIQVNPLLLKEDIERLDAYPIPRDSKKIVLSEFLEMLERNTGKKVSESFLEDIRRFFGRRLVDDIFPKRMTFFDLLPLERILLSGKAKTWKEAIKEGGELLLDCVEESYIEDMIQVVEDYGSYVLLVDSCIFPHAKAKEKIKKSGFSLVRYEEGIDFIEGKKIHLVLCFASSDKNEHLDTLVHLVEILENPKKRSEILKKKTKEEIYKIFVEAGRG